MPALAASFLGIFVLLAIIATILLSGPSRAILRLGLVSSLRRPWDALYLALPTVMIMCVLTSSLSIGDSLSGTVRDTVSLNMSEVGSIVYIPDHAPVSEDTLAELRENGVHGVVMIEGTVTSGERSAKATIIGCNREILELLPMEIVSTSQGEAFPSGPAAFVNRELAASIGARHGDIIEATVSTPESRNLIASDTTRSLMDLTVGAVVANSGIGRFRTDTRQEIPSVVIVELGYLSQRLGAPEGINAFLSHQDLDKEDVRTLLDRTLEPGDLGFELVESGAGPLLRSSGFLFGDIDVQGHRSMAYFLDSISGANGTVPYSTMIGIEPLDPLFGHMVPDRGGVVLNDVAAQRLGVRAGDMVSIAARKYSLVEGLFNISFDVVVERIVDISMMSPLKDLVPPIEGITDRASCTDWSPSFGVDLSAIGDADIEYWNEHGTTPKAILNLKDARSFLGNEFGDTTGIVLEGPLQRALESVRGNLSIENTGGRTVDARKVALGSDRALGIFPMMFLSFGLPMVIGAGLTLLGIAKGYFAKRGPEWSIVRSLGAGTRSVFLASVLDALVPLTIGAALGIPIGAGCASALNHLLNSVWSGSVEYYSIDLFISLDTLVLSSVSGWLAGILLVGASSLRMARDVPIANSRSPEIAVPGQGPKRVHRAITGPLPLMAGIFLIVLSGLSLDGIERSAAFVAGASLASAGLAVSMLHMLRFVETARPSSRLAVLNLVRRPRLTPIVVSVLAMGLSIAVSLSAIAGHLGSSSEAILEDYGGGREYIVELTSPDRETIDAGSVVLMDMGATVTELISVGEIGGTCSNINAPFPPRILGVLPDGSFRLVGRSGHLRSDEEAWSALENRIGGRIPIMVDQNTLTWVYYEGIGSVFRVEGDGGMEYELEVIGILAPSVLTGTFVMHRSFVLEMFPRSFRPSVLLIDVPEKASIDPVTAISSAFSMMGPEISSVRSLAEENLRFELGYLELFRQFLLAGIATGILSALAFGAARTLEPSADLLTLRSIGARRSVLASSVLTENMIVMGIGASSATIVGAFSSVGPWSLPGSIGLGALIPVASVPAAVLVLSLAMSTAGAVLVTGPGWVRARRCE